MRKILLLSIFIASSFLIGCNTKIADNYQQEAYNRVKATCEEDITYQRSETLDYGKYRYWYKSDIRDLTFYVDSYVENNTRVYSTNYHDVVASIYRTAIIDYLDNTIENFNKTDLSIVISSPEDLQEVAHAFAKCEEIYSVENQYHSYDYTDDFSPVQIKVLDNRLCTIEKYDFSDYSYVGMKSENAILQELTMLYEYECGGVIDDQEVY